MTEDVYYTIGELAEQAGVTPRTIRYYTAEGLLPPPDTRGRYALYSAEHLRRLQLIARLKEAYLPLGEIKSRLEPLTSDQVQQLLDETVREEARPTSASAAAYIAQVLAAPGPTPRVLAEPQQVYQPAPPAPAPPAPAAAPREQRGFLRGLITGRRQGDAQAVHPGEVWQRVPLAPGVELHVREPAAPALRERVERLIAQARALFQEDE